MARLLYDSVMGLQGGFEDILGVSWFGSRDEGFDGLRFCSVLGLTHGGCGECFFFLFLEGCVGGYVDSPKTLNQKQWGLSGPGLG